MDIDIRQSIIKNFKESSTDEMRESIEASIKDQEEITLPGLGVFFEILWNNSNEKKRNYILKTIEESI